jgi:hypothetical protein
VQPAAVIQAADKATAKTPSAMTECEANSCARGIQGAWEFDHAEGIAKWTNGGGAKLTIERFDAEAVVIRRVDLPQTLGYGIVGIYRGVLKGNRIDGTLTYSVRNGPEQQMPWYATIGAPEPKTTSDTPPEAPKPPIQIVPVIPPTSPLGSNQTAEPQFSTSSPPKSAFFCGAATCFTLQWENGRYTRSGLPDETFTVESFTKESVVLHRHDTPQKWNGFSADVVYAGTVHTDGSSLTNTRIAGAPGEFTLRWGNALRAPSYIAMKMMIPNNGNVLADMVRVPGSELYDALWPGNTRALVSVQSWNAGPVIRIEHDATFPGVTAEGQSPFVGSFNAPVTWQGQWPFQMSFTSPMPRTTFWRAGEGPPVKNPPPACDPNTRENLDEKALWSRVVGARILDMRQAVCWHAVGAAREMVEFQTQYAYDFLYGVGVKQDYAAARLWAEKAAAHGDENALFILADIYYEGLGVAKDEAKVRAWNAKRATLEIEREKKLVGNFTIGEAVGRCVDDWGRMARTGVDCYEVVALDLHGRSQAVTGQIFKSYQGAKEKCLQVTGQREREECSLDVLSRESGNSVSSFLDAAALDARIASLRKFCQRNSSKTLSNGDSFDAPRCERAISGQKQ